MFIKFLNKIYLLSKLYFNVNCTFYLFNNFFLYINFLNSYNLYFFKEVINITLEICNYKKVLIKNFNFQKFNLYYQKKLNFLKRSNYYNF